MADKAIKKILIFACPRTGSTVIQQSLAHDLFRIPDLIEPFNDPVLGFDLRRHAPVAGKQSDLYKWTQEQPAGVIKLRAINLDYVEIDRLLKVGNFDRIVVIERKNLVDCCVSLCLAEQTSKYHYYPGDSVDVKPFKCDTDSVNHWINMYRQYLTALKLVKNSGVPYDTICYEDFMNNQIQYVAGVPLEKKFSRTKKSVSLELPYRELCLNYAKVEKRITKALQTSERSKKTKTERKKKKLAKRLRT